MPAPSSQGAAAVFDPLRPKLTDGVEKVVSLVAITLFA
jgi:hypothetical protein